MVTTPPPAVKAHAGDHSERRRRPAGGWPGENTQAGSEHQSVGKSGEKLKVSTPPKH